MLEDQFRKIQGFVAKMKWLKTCGYKIELPFKVVEHPVAPYLIAPKPPARREPMFTREEKILLNKLLKNANSKIKDNDLLDDDQKKETSELLSSINKKVLISEEALVPNDIKIMINGKEYTTTLMKS